MYQDLDILKNRKNPTFGMCLTEIGSATLRYRGILNAYLIQT